MKHLKIIGLALVAAAALMACAGSASAAPTLTSPAGTEYTGTLTLSGSSSMLFQNTFANMTCTGSAISANISTNNETHASASIMTLSFSGCSATFDPLKNADGTYGSLTIKPNGEVFVSNMRITKEAGGVHCIFGGSTSTKLGTFTPSSTTGKTAVLDISASLPYLGGTGSSFTCGSTATWSGTYTVTTPDDLNLESAAAAPALTSPEGTAYTGTIEATASSSLLLKATFANVTCTASTMVGNVVLNNETHASAPITALSFGNCSTTTDPLQNGDGFFGSLTINQKGEVFGFNSRVTMVAAGAHCIFGTSGSGTKLGTLTPSSVTEKTAVLDISASLPYLGGTSSFVCGSIGTWTGRYTVTTPDVLNLA